ncbi:MAG: hypothetical protein IT578_04480 [Verrucomicrobiae bacterium]|nr:hypothetical protein [Verrucomicrobiae bacterium]
MLCGVLSAWLAMPAGVMACGACSEVAINSSMEVSPESGSLNLRQSDGRLSGYAGIDLEREYDSRNNMFSMFGYGWQPSWLANLATTAGDITVNFGTLSETFVATNGYVNASGTMVLSFNGEGTNQTVEVKERVGGRWTFSGVNGACLWQEDRNGNRTTYEITVTNKVVGAANGSNVVTAVYLPTRVTYADGREVVLTTS